MARPAPLVRSERRFKQARAADTHRALLEAAERVFARRGYDAAQTPEIAAGAGVSTGAFYRYFTDKHQAFVEVCAAHLERAHADVMKRLDPSLFRGADARRAIDRALDVLFDHVRRAAPLERVYLSMSLQDPDVRRLRGEFEAKALDSLTALVAAVIPRRVAPDARAAALVIQVAALEVAGERAGLRPRSGPRVADRAVKAALGDMLHRYLFGSTRTP
jgi:AcrR family transcriptional regulator